MTSMVEPEDRVRLRPRLIVTIALATIMSLVALTATTYVLVRQENLERATDAALDQTRTNLALVVDLLDTPTTSAVTEVNYQLERVGRFEIVADVGGEIVRSQVGFGRDAVPPRLRDPGGSPVHSAATVDGQRYIVVAAEALPELDYYFFFPLDRVLRNLGTLLRVLVLTTLCLSAVAVGAAVIAARPLLRPVDRTAQAARSLAAGVLEARVPTQGPDEFADLVDDFNDMAEALQRTIDRLATLESSHRQFVADVSHELRTPLTVLTTAADLLEPGVGELRGPQRRAAELLIGEVQRLNAMVDDLMEISRLDAGAAAVDLDRVDLGVAVAAVLRHRGWADDVEIRTPRGDMRIVTDRRRLHAILSNVVGNALEHGAPPVTVSVAARRSELVVSVDDAGLGVPVFHRERIFERFHKVDPARTRHHGSGLGLAIARDNARLLGGDLVLDDSPTGGARFVLTLPRSAPLQPPAEVDAETRRHAGTP